MVDGRGAAEPPTVVARRTAAEVEQTAPGALSPRPRRALTLPSNDLSPDTAIASSKPEELADATSSNTAELEVVTRLTGAGGLPTGEFLGWSKRYVRAQVAMDVVVGTLAVVIGSTLPSALAFDGANHILLLLAGAIAWPVAVSIAHGYDDATIGVGDDELRAVLRAGVSLIAAGSVTSVLFETGGLSPLVVWGAPLAALASLTVRYTGRKFLHRQQRLGRHLRRVMIVGSADTAADLAAVLDREPHCGMKVVGVCVPAFELADSQDAGLTVIGDLDQVPQLIASLGVDAVAVSGGEATRHSYLRELSWAMEGSGVELLVHPGLVEVAGPRMHIRPYVGLPLLHVEHPHFTGWRRFVKRGADVSLSLVGLVLAAPLMLAIAIAIKLSDGGPAIFRQTRVGLEGSTFTLVKFRTMHCDAESRLAELEAEHPKLGGMFKLEEDPRVTRIGRLLRRFSLDELPQLLNVLVGSMSLVGPRPPLQAEVDRYEDHARRRLLVTPGLTGLWQVSGRSLLSWEETVRLDLRYVENWTLTLDLLIMWKTAFAVLTKRGAF